MKKLKYNICSYIVFIMEKVITDIEYLDYLISMDIKCIREILTRLNVSITKKNNKVIHYKNVLIRKLLLHFDPYKPKKDIDLTDISNKKIPKQDIDLSDIDLFYNISGRAENDSSNKKRESIICCIINNKIPHKYYDKKEWFELKNNINTYINNICELNNIEHINTCECVRKGGRSNHYDLELKINATSKFKIEFKYNAGSVDDAPQYVSLMKPSQYLEESYEEYYYDNYLCNWISKYNFIIPKREEYLKIHPYYKTKMYD